MLKESGQNGIFINEDFQDLTALLWADDMAQIGDTVGRVQNLLQTLETKTNIVVFRNGGIVKHREKMVV
jgi:hypothetical protein